MLSSFRAGIVLALALLAHSFPCTAASKVHNTLTPREIADGWIRLFDGETLFGWAPRGTAEWSVVDGTLTPKQGTGAGFLCTTSEFADYELSVEFWIDAVANSGVFLRCPTAGSLTTSNAYEVNIYDPHPKWPTGSINDVAARRRAVRTVGRWNRYDIRAEGPHFVVRLNGTRVLDTVNGAHPRGVIGLQTFNGQGVIRFRNVKLRPLGARPIFNGRDLSGWNEVPGHKSVYSVTREGWLNVKNGNGDLQTEGRYGDFILQLDVLSNGQHLNSGIFFRAIPGEFWKGYESQIRNQWEGDDRSKPVDYGTGGIYRRQPARRVVSSDGAWFTKTLVAHGRHFAVWVNGYQVSDWTDDRPANDNAREGYRAAPGVISLQGHDPTTDLSFRNLRVATFPPSQP